MVDVQLRAAEQRTAEIARQTRDAAEMHRRHTRWQARRHAAAVRRRAEEVQAARQADAAARDAAAAASLRAVTEERLREVCALEGTCDRAMFAMAEAEGEPDIAMTSSADFSAKGSSELD